MEDFHVRHGGVGAVIPVNEDDDADSALRSGLATSFSLIGVVEAHTSEIQSIIAVSK
jgi:hypothetical protein